MTPVTKSDGALPRAAPSGLVRMEGGVPKDKECGNAFPFDTGINCQSPLRR